MLYRAAPCTTSSDYYVVTIKVLSAARQRFPAGRNSISTCAVFRPVRFLSEYVMPRRIYTDGRTRPEEVEAAFAGYSIGKWIDQDGDGRYDVLEVETTHMKGPRNFDVDGLPLHNDNQSIIKERIFLDKDNPDLLHDEITTIDHALTRPWTVMKSYRREKNPIWNEYDCNENNNHVAIGKENYFLSADGYLMPGRKGQQPPDLRYFDQVRK
jgi:hypothetical protein